MPQPREPLFNAPVMAVILPALILAGYAGQVAMGPMAEDMLLNVFALSPLLLRQGHVELLISYQFLHGSWSHVIFNAVFLLAFGTPVVRAFRSGAGPAVSFIGFYLLCGILAGLGYCILNWYDATPIIGASGAISGLMGAAIRVRGDGQLNSLISRRVLAMTVVWIGVNLASAFVPLMPGTENVLVAWQAHIAGYLTGLLLVGVWLRLFHGQYFTTN